MLDIIIIVAEVLAALAIVLYATWLLMSRLRHGDKKAQSFGEWLKHVFEAVWGL